MIYVLYMMFEQKIRIQFMLNLRALNSSSNITLLKMSSLGKGGKVSGRLYFRTPKFADVSKRRMGKCGNRKKLLT